MLYESIIASPLGRLRLVATDAGLKALLFLDHGENLPYLPASVDAAPSHTVLKHAATELDEYFAGTRRTFTVPLDLSAGTEFQRRVWASLLKIPYGTTVTYGEQTKRLLGLDRGYRAVAGANGRNPVAIIVPCHRVVAANGHLHGFACGLPIKERLLRHEGLTIRNNRIEVKEEAPLELKWRSAELQL